jgi:hypothetical protein
MRNCESLSSKPLQDALESLIRDLSAIDDKHSNHWAAYFRTSLILFQRSELELGLSHLNNAFGGMGSYLDVAWQFEAAKASADKMSEERHKFNRAIRRQKRAMK